VGKKYRVLFLQCILISWSLGQIVTSAPANQQQASADPARPTVIVSGNGDHLALAGVLEISTLTAARNSLKQWSKRGPSRSLDVAKLDTASTRRVRCSCAVFVTRA